MIGVDAPMPAGAFYLWAPAPKGDAWALARRLAEQGGALVSPGEFYGPDAVDHVRVAVVQPDDRIALVAERLVAAGTQRTNAGYEPPGPRPRGPPRRSRRDRLAPSTVSFTEDAALRS